VRWLRSLEQSDWLDLAIVLPPLTAFGFFLLTLAEGSDVTAAVLAVAWMLTTAALVLVARRLLRRFRALRGLASFLIVAATAVAVPVIWLAWFEPDPWIVDESVMRVTKTRLSVVAHDLDDLPRYGATSTRAEVTGCGMDSGGVFQPAASRTWGHADRGVRDSIVRDLAAKGWVRSPAVDRNAPLTKKFGDWTAEAYVGSAYDGFPAFVEARVERLEPCSPRDLID
jgi:hypothetical protein